LEDDDSSAPDSDFSGVVVEPSSLAIGTAEVEALLPPVRLRGVILNWNVMFCVFSNQRVFGAGCIMDWRTDLMPELLCLLSWRGEAKSCSAMWFGVDMASLEDEAPAYVDDEAMLSLDNGQEEDPSPFELDVEDERSRVESQEADEPSESARVREELAVEDSAASSSSL
jgi:hypothetical protein